MGSKYIVDAISGSAVGKDGREGTLIISSSLEIAPDDSSTLTSKHITGSISETYTGQPFINVTGAGSESYNSITGQWTINIGPIPAGGSSLVGWTSPQAGMLNTTGSIAAAGGELGTAYVASNVGSDVFFFISGTIDSRNTANTGSAVFGGDLHISGNLTVEGSSPGGGGGGGSGVGWTSPQAGMLNATGSIAAVGGELGTSYVASNVGSDVFFFVSGTIDSMNTSNTGSAVFGGDAVISGSTKIGHLTSSIHQVTGTLWVSGAIGSHRPWLGINSGSGLGVGGVAEENTTPFIFYVDSGSMGSDYNDGLSAATPLKTIKKALELSPWNVEHSYGIDPETPNWGGGTQINIASGTYNWPTSIYGANELRIMGTTSSFDSMVGNWTVVSSSRPDGSIVDATFSNTYSEDELKGTFIQLSSSLEPVGWIYANEASDGSVTRIYFVCDDGPENLPDNDSFLRLVNLDTKLEPNQYVIESKVSDSINFAIHNVHFRTPENLLPHHGTFNRAFLAFRHSNSSVKNCKFGNDHAVSYNAFSKVSVAHGTTSFQSCYFRLKGRDVTSVENGHRTVYCGDNGTIYLGQGSVLEGCRVMAAAQGSPQVRLNGEIVFSRCF